MMRKLLFTTTAALTMFNAQAKIDLSKETNAYHEFVTGQIDLLVKDTESFAETLKAGDLEKAKAIYPIVRMYYERSEPIAESFGDLDPRIDARLADVIEEVGAGKSSPETEKEAIKTWTGFHKIEKILWEENTTQGTEKIADELVKDIKELRAKIPTAEVTPELMITGAVDLLNEISTSKITGEEDIFSKTDLFDFKANIEGAEKIFELFRPHVEAKNAELAQEIDTRFKDVNSLLAKHNNNKEGGYNYVAYNTLTPEDIKALAEAVNKLGEPLAQMGIILE